MSDREKEIRERIESEVLSLRDHGWQFECSCGYKFTGTREEADEAAFIHPMIHMSPTEALAWREENP